MMVAIPLKGDSASPDPEQYRSMMGPGYVDNSIRQSIQLCWMMLPAERKTLEALEQEYRRLVDRAFRDMKEDQKSLGGKKP
jgi:hypothetical protein